MKTTDLLPFFIAMLISGLSLTGCGTTGIQAQISREEAAKHMPLLTEHEAKRQQAKTVLHHMYSAGMLNHASDTTQQKIKRAMDLEYIYYYAAMTSLAAGKLQDYTTYLKLGGKEIDTVMDLLINETNAHPLAKGSPRTGS